MDSIIRKLYLGQFEPEHLSKQVLSKSSLDKLSGYLDELQVEKGYGYTENLYEAIVDVSVQEQTEAFANGIRFAFRLFRELDLLEKVK